MNRRNFLAITGGTIVVAGIISYLISDKNNFTRSDSKENETSKIPLRPDERAMYLWHLLRQVATIRNPGL